MLKYPLITFTVLLTGCVTIYNEPPNTMPGAVNQYGTVKFRTAGLNADAVRKEAFDAMFSTCFGKYKIISDRLDNNVFNPGIRIINYECVYE